MISEMGDHPDIIELAGKVTVVGIVLVFFVVIFFCCLHLYFKWYYLHRNPPTTTTARERRRHRRRFDFTAGHQEIVFLPTSSSSGIGLEPSVLESIPIVAFDPKEFKDGLLECAVCLCEVCEGEKARILPKCNHGFHVECIDMWFHSHATCPLCRNPIPNQKSPTSAYESAVDIDESSSEGPNFPANVLIWGDDTQVNACVEDDNVAATTSQPSTSATSSSTDGVLVIDIPIESRN